jgi:hypothetical protein
VDLQSTTWTRKKPSIGRLLGLSLSMLGRFKLFGGERGIRTLDTVLAHTHFPGVLLQPLGHLTKGR